MNSEEFESIDILVKSIEFIYNEILILEHRFKNGHITKGEFKAGLKPLSGKLKDLENLIIQNRFI